MHETGWLNDRMIGCGCGGEGCIGPGNKQERESEIGKQDGRGGIQMNALKYEHRDKHNGTMMPKR